MKKWVKQNWTKYAIEKSHKQFQIDLPEAL